MSCSVDFMLFNSLIFWVFFSVFSAAFFATNGSWRLRMCLAGSYLFYGWWDWRFLGLIGFLTVANYWFGLRMAASDSAVAHRRWITASVVTSLGVLGFFKYWNFFVDSARAGLEAAGVPFHGGSLEIILPVGISFYTFQAMSYTIDLYRREIGVERSLLRFATYIAFFPQLVAGPIVRASEFLPQLRRDAAWEWGRFVEGACIVAWGMVLKVVVADSLAPVVDARFFAVEAMTALSLVIGVVFYAFQIYGDFAGYSLMAIGFAHVLGYQFSRNFDRPYFADSFSDFWKRWHISLSSWLRDYLYIPLGGNRRGRRRTYLNLMLTMLLGGLWHGAAWTFVIWGALHGAYLCLQRLLGRVGARLLGAGGPDARALGTRGLGARRLGVVGMRLVQMAAVFVLVCVAWVFFRTQSVGEAWTVFARIAAGEDWSFAAVEQKFQVLKGAGLIAGLVAVEALSFRVNYWAVGRRWPVTVGVFLIGCLLAVAFLGNFTGNAFIYFQF